MLPTPQGSPENSMLCSGRGGPLAEKTGSSPHRAGLSCDQGFLRSIPGRSGAADVRWGHLSVSPLWVPPRTLQQSLFLQKASFQLYSQRGTSKWLLRGGTQVKNIPFHLPAPHLLEQCLRQQGCHWQFYL